MIKPPPYQTATAAMDALFEMVKDFDSIIWVDFTKGLFNGHRTLAFTVYGKQDIVVEVRCRDQFLIVQSEIDAALAAIKAFYVRILRHGGVVWFQEELQHLYTHRVGEHGAVMGDDQDAVLAAIRLGETSWERITR